MTAPLALRVLKIDGAFAPKVLRFDGPMGRGLWYRPGAAKRPGFRRFKRFRGFKGEGIAFGDEFYMPLTRPPSTAIAVPLPHRWGEASALRDLHLCLQCCMT